MNPNFVILVEIPALQNLVDYLREKDDFQSKVDALAETITTLTQKLAMSSGSLKAAVASQQK